MKESELISNLVSYFKQYGTNNANINYAYDNIIGQVYFRCDTECERIMNKALNLI